MNRFIVLFVGLLTFMWGATLLDKTLNLGWGWDSQILWGAPLLMLFAALLRFCAMAIFKFVEGND